VIIFLGSAGLLQAYDL